MNYDESDKQILIHSSNGQFYLWNINDIKYVRKTYHIIGTFVGSPNWSNVVYQNKIHGLPLKLLNEECLFLLSECKNAKLINQFNLINQNIIDQCVKESKEFENDFQVNFKSIHYRHSIEQIKNKLDLIVQCKAAKRKISIEEIDKNELFDKQIKRIKLIDEHNQPKQLFIQSPWSISFKEIDFKFDELIDKDKINNLNNQIDNKPKLNDKHSLIRYLTYRDLNKKGLYLTKGYKFGSDFLAYPTDPLICHSQYLVICLSDNQPLTKTTLHTFTRLGSQVNKNVLFVRLKNRNLNNNDNNEFNNSIELNQLEYMVIKWESNI